MPQDSKPGEVDLHGLFVKEAIEHTDEAIQAAQRRGDSEVHLIVGMCMGVMHERFGQLFLFFPNSFPVIGKGLHSPHHQAKLKPAVEELLDKYGPLLYSYQI